MKQLGEPLSKLPDRVNLTMNCYDLTDCECSVIEPSLLNNPRCPRVDGRRVPNGIMWVLRFGDS